MRPELGPRVAAMLWRRQAFAILCALRPSDARAQGIPLSEKLAAQLRSIAVRANAAFLLEPEHAAT